MDKSREFRKKRFIDIKKIVKLYGNLTISG
nr:MAG TPA: hypothetical protein [Caudoviricetes sp.]